MAQDNERAGYKTIQGFLMDIGVTASVTTIKNILKKHGVEPAPDREKHLSWDKFIKAHKDMLWGCDFFTQEVWSMKGLATYYVLVFIHLGSRKLEVIAMTQNPTMEWTTQQARNFVYDKDEVPEKAKMKYLIHDAGVQFDHKWNKDFLTIFKSEGVKLCKVNHPQLNSFSERVIQSIQNQCTNRLIFIGEKSLRYALKQYQMFYNTERHHQGIGNVIPFPSSGPILKEGEVKKSERLGGLLCQYHREAA
jgi:putative transposase